MITRTRTTAIVVHHSVSPKNTTVAQITAWHKQRGFATIGYHWLINSSGIHEGRDEEMVGAHCRAQGMNYKSIGICVAGNYQEEILNSGMRDNLVQLLRKKIDKYKLTTGDINGHRFYAPTACPGDNLYNDLSSIRDDVNKLNKTNMVLKRIYNQTREKHGNSEVAIVHCPEDESLWLIKGGKRRKITSEKKQVEALTAMHAIGLTEEDLAKIDQDVDL